MQTFETGPLVKSMDVGCSQPRPGVVGGREGKAVGGVEFWRDRGRIGHDMFDGDGC